MIRKAPPSAEPAVALLSPAPSADAAEIFDQVVSRLFLVGLLLQSTESMPAESVRQVIADAIEHLDDTIRGLRDAIFAADA